MRAVKTAFAPHPAFGSSQGHQVRHVDGEFPLAAAPDILQCQASQPQTLKQVITVEGVHLQSD